MRNLGFFTIVLGFFLFAGSASATTYYIDYATGSDANSGTSKTAPWMHAPGMQGCSAVCASTAPKPADSFILKGGVTWPNSVFPQHWSWSGSNGSPIYIGVDKTWYTGASWNRPIFDAGGTPISGSWDGFLQAYSPTISYVTFDSIEMKGLNWQTAYSTGAMVCASIGGSSHVTFENVYVHGWSHTGGVTTDAFACFVTSGNTTGNVIDHSIFDGTDSTNGGDSGAFTYAWPSVTNSVVHDATNALLLSGSGESANNLIYNIHRSFDTSVHENAIEYIGTGTHYLHDNIIAGTVYGENMMVGNTNEIDYIWNNVIATGSGNPVHFPQSTGMSNMSMYAWNNTIVPASGVQCFLSSGFGGSWNTIDIRNNHCITTNSNIASTGLTVTTLIVNYNALMTPTEAAAAGYTSAQTYAYSPTASNCSGQANCPVGAGTNLASIATAALAGLQSDTNYACTQQTISGVVQAICPARTDAARPSSGAWDAGAYFLSGARLSGSPAAPTSLVAVAN